MRVSPGRIVQRYSLAIAVLFHLLLLFGMTYVVTIRLQEHRKPGLDIPPAIESYVYNNAVNSPAEQPQVPKLPGQQINAAVRQHDAQRPNPVASNADRPDLSMLRKVKQFNVMNVSRKTEPVHLIGDKNVAAPLLVLLGKALTARLVYPKIAIDFNVRGLVLVGFVLHPDGTISDSQLVRSSGAGVLDNEAMRALNAISPVPDVSPYLNEPRFLVIGILFG